MYLSIHSRLTRPLRFWSDAHHPIPISACPRSKSCAMPSSTLRAWRISYRYVQLYPPIHYSLYIRLSYWFCGFVGIHAHSRHRQPGAEFKRQKLPVRLSGKFFTERQLILRVWGPGSSFRNYFLVKFSCMSNAFIHFSLATRTFIKISGSGRFLVETWK